MIFQKSCIRNCVFLTTDNFNPRTGFLSYYKSFMHLSFHFTDCDIGSQLCRGFVTTYTFGNPNFLPKGFNTLSLYVVHYIHVLVKELFSPTDLLSSLVKQVHAQNSRIKISNRMLIFCSHKRFSISLRDRILLSRYSENCLENGKMYSQSSSVSHWFFFIFSVYYFLILW